MDYGKKFRTMADRHMEETGEMVFSGKDSNGYYFTFGFFPNDRVADALVAMERLREAVPHVTAYGMDNGKEFTYRQCPETYCINAPHPTGTRHGDNTGATWHSGKDGQVRGLRAHDGE